VPSLGSAKLRPVLGAGLILAEWWHKFIPRVKWVHKVATETVPSLGPVKPRIPLTKQTRKPNFGIDATRVGRQVYAIRPRVRYEGLVELRIVLGAGLILAEWWYKFTPRVK